MYLNIMTERLSNNIFNALCTEILDQLHEKLRTEFTIELYGDDVRRDFLLKERPEIEQKRLDLDRKIQALEKAATTLGELNRLRK